MAINRNQHYVPKSYLRNFAQADSGDGKRSATNSYLFTQDRFVQSVSIKGQCSSSYFYGRSQEVDAAMQLFESRYSRIVSELTSGEMPVEYHKHLSQTFLLQLLRTDGAANRRLDVIAQFEQRGLVGMEEHARTLPKPSKQDETLANLVIFLKNMNMLNDLRGVILINQTNVPFIASDDPACLINRLNAQRYKDKTGGLITSGAICVLPLTPSLLYFAYDGDVYVRFETNGQFNVTNRLDVMRLNELQAQTATNSIYFHDWSQRERLREFVDTIRPFRKDRWSFNWIGVEAGIEQHRGVKFQVYKKATEADLRAGSPRINVTSPILPEPSCWPTFTSIKRKPVGYTTGSAVGFVRERIAIESPEKKLERVVLPFSIPANATPQGREVVYQKI